MTPSTSTTTLDAPEGSELFLVTGAATFHRVRVARLTKTQIILDNGRRFSSDGAREIGGRPSPGFGSTPRLKLITDPRLLLLEAQQRYTASLRLLAQYADRIAGYGDPIAAEADTVSLDLLWSKAQDAKAAVQALQ